MSFCAHLDVRQSLWDIGHWFASLFLVCSLLLLFGCASMTGEESDVPWNVPQPWEGAPMIPGSQ